MLAFWALAALSAVNGYIASLLFAGGQSSAGAFHVVTAIITGLSSLRFGGGE